MSNQNESLQITSETNNTQLVTINYASLQEKAKAALKAKVSNVNFASNYKEFEHGEVMRGVIIEKSFLEITESDGTKKQLNAMKLAEFTSDGNINLIIVAQSQLVNTLQVLPVNACVQITRQSNKKTKAGFECEIYCVNLIEC